MSLEQTKWWTRIPYFGNLGLALAEKEVRSQLRKSRFFWVQFSYLVIIGLVFGTAMIVMAGAESDVSPNQVGISLLYTFACVQSCLIFLIFPAFAATSISGERAEKSFDLLITTDMTPAEIVWGKFVGVFGNCCYYLLASVPILACSVLLGGVNIGIAALLYAYLLICSAFTTIVGITISSGSNSNLRSIISTYIVSMVVGGLNLALLVGIGESYIFRGVPLFQNAPPDLIGFLVSCVLFVFGLIFAFCFVFSVSKLTSEEGNRSTGMRVLVLLTGLVVAAHLYWAYDFFSATNALSNVWQVQGWLFSLTFWAGVYCVLLLPIFVTESTRSPRRLDLQMRKFPAITRATWILQPGGIRGLCFALMIFVGVFFLLSLVGANMPLMDKMAPGSSTQLLMADFFHCMWALLLAMGIFYAGLSFFLNQINVSGLLNWVVVLLAAFILNVHPFVYDMVTSANYAEPQFYQLRELSFVFVIQAFTNELPSRVADYTPEAGHALASRAIALSWALGLALIVLSFVIAKKKGVALLALKSFHKSWSQREAALSKS